MLIVVNHVNMLLSYQFLPTRSHLDVKACQSVPGFNMGQQGPLLAVVAIFGFTCRRCLIMHKLGGYALQDTPLAVFRVHDDGEFIIIFTQTGICVSTKAH